MRSLSVFNKSIHDPWNGAHPVSGNRVFGYTVDSSGYTFYVKGADRINGTIQDIAGYALNLSTATPFQFLQADALWNSYSTKIAAFVNTHGGSSSTNSPIKLRPKWKNVQTALRNNQPLSTIPCN